MDKKIQNILIAVTILLIVAIGSFYGGVLYTRNYRNSQFSMQGPGGGIAINGNGTNKQGGTGMNSGEIISKDPQSITIKLTNGGSKIIMLLSSTEISKSTSGTSDDLAVGKNVTIQGTTNSDGSVTAKTIQIRPLPTQPQ